MTDSLDVLTQYIVELLKADAELGLTDVWYGDEQLIPRTPAASVDADYKRRDMANTGMMTRNDFRVFVTLYHASLGSTGFNRREAVQLAERVEDKMHSDRTMGGNVVHGYVTEVAPGFARRAKSIMVATRLTWEGFSKTRIGV